MFKRNYSVTILDTNWKKICDLKTAKFLPRKDELLFIGEQKKYYRVVEIVNFLTEKQGIFLIVEEYKEKIFLKFKPKLDNT